MDRSDLVIEDGMLVLLVAFVDLELQLDVARSSLMPNNYWKGTESTVHMEPMQTTRR
jgi:hypothetical protein